MLKSALYQLFGAVAYQFLIICLGPLGRAAVLLQHIVRSQSQVINRIHQRAVQIKDGALKLRIQYRSLKSCSLFLRALWISRAATASTAAAPTAPDAQ